MSLFKDPTIARVTALILKVLEKAPHQPHSSTGQLSRSSISSQRSHSPRFSDYSRRWSVRVLSTVR
jgi:hypothetical protein